MCAIRRGRRSAKFVVSLSVVEWRDGGVVAVWMILCVALDIWADERVCRMVVWGVGGRRAVRERVSFERRMRMPEERVVVLDGESAVGSREREVRTNWVWSRMSCTNDWVVSGDGRWSSSW